MRVLAKRSEEMPEESRSEGSLTRAGLQQDSAVRVGPQAQYGTDNSSQLKRHLNGPPMDP
jgi:hypothetical protein